MKSISQNFLVLLFALFSLQATAIEYEGALVEPYEFEELTDRLDVSVDSEKYYSPYWRTSYATCRAATVCPNGRTIWCQTYGANYSAVPSHMVNSCRFMVYPGRAVRCQGYGQQFDYYGRAFWSVVDIPVSCY